MVIGTSQRLWMTQFGRVRTFALLMTVALSTITPLSVASAADVVLENLSINAGYQTYAIKRIDVQGSSLSAEELTALLTGKTADVIGTLARFDATRISIPELSMTQEFAGVAATGVYRDFVMEGISKGKVASTTTREMTTTSPGLSEEPLTKMEGRMGRMTLKDFDMTTLARVVIEKQSGPDQPLTTLYGTYEAESYTISSPLYEISIGKVSGSGFQGRPMAVPLLEALSKLPKLPAAGAEPTTPPNPEQMKPFMALVAGVYNDFAFSDTQMNDVKIAIKAGPKPQSFSIARIGMRDFAKARIGEMSMEGLTTALDQGSIKLATIKLKDLNFQAFLKLFQLMSEKGFGDPAKPEESPLAGVDPRAFVPSIGQFTMTGLDVDVPSPVAVDAAAQPVAPAGSTKLSIGTFDLQTSNWLMAIPTKVAMTLDKLALTLPPGSPPAADLKALGIDTLNLSSKLAAGWDETTQDLTIDALSVDAGQLGSLSAKGALGNISKDLFVGDPMLQQVALFSATFKALEVDVKNSGLMEASFAASAKEQGMTPDELKSNLITAVSVGLPAMLGNSDESKKVAEALAKFIASPKSLKFSANAPRGFGASDMLDPASIGEKLKLSATANE